MLHSDLVGRAVFRKLQARAKLVAYPSFGAITPTKPVSIHVGQKINNMHSKDGP